MVGRTKMLRQTRVTAIIAVAAAAAFLMGLLLVSSPIPEGSIDADRASRSVVEPDFRSRTTYSSLDDLNAASDLVAVGTVIGVKPGRLAGDPRDGAEGQVQFHDVSIMVDRVLSGPGDSDRLGTELRIEMLFLPGSSGTFASKESPWWQPGASSLFFVRFDSSASGRESLLVSPEGIQFLPDGQDGRLRAAGTEPIPEIDGSTVQDVQAALESQVGN